MLLKNIVISASIFHLFKCITPFSLDPLTYFSVILKVLFDNFNIWIISWSCSVGLFSLLSVGHIFLLYHVLLFFFFSMSCFLNEKICLLRVVEAKVVRVALRAGSQFNVYLN